MNKEERRLLAWLDDQMKGHECTFAENPFDDRLEYCQFCGKMRVKS